MTGTGGAIRRAHSAAATAIVVSLCAVTLLLGYLNKARCAVAPFFDNGRSEAFDAIKDSSVCYSDIQFLWLGRDIDNHVFPYLSGAITSDGILTGGTVEYPVLSGLLMWLGAVPAHTDAQFLLYSALLLAPFGLATAWMLGRLAGNAALLWAAGPPLVMYAFHNWELPVVAAAVGAVFVMGTGAVKRRWSLRTRATVAAVLLGIGFCLKLYPGAFVLPLAAYVAYAGARGDKKLDVRGGLSVIATATATVVAINLPFAVLGYEGWRASFAFQTLRQADITTNSIWFWGLRRFFVEDSMNPEYEQAEASFQDTVDVLSPMLVCAAFVLALWLGARRAKSENVYPWIAVSASMLCGFLLFHKVHSPQYTLWLLPFFVLLRVPWSLVLAYLLADLSMGIGVFKYFAALSSGADASTEEFFVEVGVWGRAVLLVVFFFLFLRARLRVGAEPGELRPDTPHAQVASPRR